MKEFTIHHPWISSIALMFATMVILIVCNLLFEGLIWLIGYILNNKNAGKLVMLLLLIVTMVITMRYVLFNG
jgi:hypothetical protein